MKSGLLSLAVSISEMMSTGPIANSVSTATRLVDAVGRNLIAWLQVEAAMLRRIPAESGQVQKELFALAGLRQELAAKFDAYPETLDAIHVNEVSLIKQRLSSTIQAFIPEALASLASDDIAIQASQIDVKLRMRLEAVFLDAIQDTGEMLAAEHEALRSESDPPAGDRWPGGRQPGDHPGAAADADPISRGVERAGRAGLLRASDAA